jgi:hypothetical protein
VSRYYDTATPGGPVELDRYDGLYGPVLPGSAVAYANEAWRTAAGDFATGGVDGLMTVEEIIDFGGGTPPQAILTAPGGETWEVSVTNLIPVTVEGDSLARQPDLRLHLILTLAATLAGRPDAATSALARHVLALDADLRNRCALPTRWAADDTVPGDGDDARPVEQVPLPGPDPGGGSVFTSGRLGQIIDQDQAWGGV